MGQSPRERLGERIRPDGGVVLLTVECQRGVVGRDSALPELAAVARASGALGNVARRVAAAHAA
ncbi:cysteine hydrolase, partial [Streptomyces sp. NPDC059082]